MCTRGFAFNPHMYCIKSVFCKVKQRDSYLFIILKVYNSCKSHQCGVFNYNSFYKKKNIGTKKPFKLY